MTWGQMSHLKLVIVKVSVELQEERWRKEAINIPSFCKDLKFPLELKHFEFDGVYEMMQLWKGEKGYEEWKAIN